MKKYRRKQKYKAESAKDRNVELHREPSAEKHISNYKKRVKLKNRRRLITLCVFAVLVIIGIMLFTPMFNISKVVVKGNAKVSNDNIVQTGRIFAGDNIWLFKLEDAEKRIEKIPYVDDVTITREFPNKIKVSVKESKPYGYVNLEKMFLIVDRDGKILEQTTKTPKNLIEIVVSKPSSTTPGTRFVEKGTSAGKYYELIIDQLKKSGYEKSTNKIEIKSDDIRFRYNGLLIIVGDTEKLDYKFDFIKTFLKERGDDVEGCFDISAPDVGGYYSENYDENAPLIVPTEESEDEESEKGEEESEGATQ